MCEWTDKQTLENNQSQAFKKKLFFWIFKKPTQALKKILKIKKNHPKSKKFFF
jgi:3-methyladenine DNA glycosylase AlkD